MNHRVSLLSLLLIIGAVHADGPKDNLVDNVRKIPPPGIAIPDADRTELQAGLDELGKKIDELRTKLKSKPALLELLPDVQIYHNAVRYALVYNEIFKPQEIPVAKKLLQQGLDRAKQLDDGKAPWNTASGLVVRGYVSQIDGSVQPYGLVVPASYEPGGAQQHRLDAWFHGRGEQLSELSFISGRQTSPGEFTPSNAFVLHPYGRYSNANKFAGEIDLFEALDHVRNHYPIDENRLVVRGFSMGGAACWQFAVHYAGRWAAAAPGAGFSETPDFLKVFQKETLQPTGYEQKLWHLYDCTDYAVNLANCPVVAYSGEKDTQKQAADMMVKALAGEGIDLVHIIGKGAGHSYTPEARTEINRRIDSIVARGRNPIPKTIRFTTWTLRYNEMLWVRVDGLEQHWERARVDAGILDDHTVEVKTQNVSAVSLKMPPGWCPLDNTRRPTVVLDAKKIEAAPVRSDRSWIAHFRKSDKGWEAISTTHDGVLRKRHGLQGPIDDAFMSRFLMVKPTGKPLNDNVAAWASAEMQHAVTHWRQQFRGEALIKNDDAVSEADIADSNLILWGDPSSNKVLARIIDRLPLRWTTDSVHLADKSFSSAQHVPLMIYPNPLNPKRYVVLNSGFTYREYDYLNNARQVPKLPDFAIIDMNVPVSSRLPGGVVHAGFFNELWK